jgi:transposase
MPSFIPIRAMKPITDNKRNNIISLLISATPVHKIKLSQGVSTSTISKICSQYCPNLPKAPGGRPCKLTAKNVHHALHLISSQRAENAVQVTRTLKTITNQSITPQTVRRHLKKAGMKAVVKKKRPLLKKSHRQARLDFALTHQHWTVEDWKKVVWSDETKINRMGSDGRKWVWKKEGEGLSDRLVEGTFKFGGGSLMMWGCMLWDGPGYACKIDGRMDGDLYIKIMEDEMRDSLAYYNKQVGDIIFQQDNDPKHTCKKAKAWFQDQGLQVLSWPAQSPDLNPIEHLWSHLKKRLGEYLSPPSGVLDLWDRVQAEWDKIEPEVCQNLIESMPRRVAAVLKARGGYTKY